MHTLLHSVTPTLQQATADPHLRQRLLGTHGQVWVSLLWGHCSFLLVHTSFFCVLQESISQSCVSSGSSMAGLMATSYKRAYATPRSAVPRAPAPVAVHCDPYLHRRHSKPDHLTCLLRNLYAGQEATVRTGDGTTDWFQIGKRAHTSRLYIVTLLI